MYRDTYIHVHTERRIGRYSQVPKQVMISRNENLHHMEDHAEEVAEAKAKAYIYIYTLYMHSHIHAYIYIWAY